MPLVEQELLTLPEYMSSNQVFSGVRVARPLVFCAIFCLSLFVLFLLVIVLSVLVSKYEFNNDNQHYRLFQHRFLQLPYKKIQLDILYIIFLNHAHFQVKVYWIQHYEIKLECRLVGVFFSHKHLFTLFMNVDTNEGKIYKERNFSTNKTNCHNRTKLLLIALVEPTNVFFMPFRKWSLSSEVG